VEIGLGSSWRCFFVQFAKEEGLYVKEKILFKEITTEKSNLYLKC
jgi:hypothetical protein